MYSLHSKVNGETLRVFKGLDSYDKRSKPIVIIEVMRVSDNEVYLYATKGKLNRAIIEKICNKFESEGIETLRMERGGQVIEYKLCTKHNLFYKVDQLIKELTREKEHG